jgi:hypothetical protein
MGDLCIVLGLPDLHACMYWAFSLYAFCHKLHFLRSQDEDFGSVVLEKVLFGLVFDVYDAS